MPTIAIANRIKPLKSKDFTDASATLGMALKVTKVPKIPMGKLIKKIQCQEAYSTNQPPKIGPINGPSKPAKLIKLIAERNCSRGMIFNMASRPTGTSNAPPIP